MDGNYLAAVCKVEIDSMRELDCLDRSVHKQLGKAGMVLHSRLPQLQHHKVGGD